MRRRGQRNIDYSVKFVPDGELCEERDSTDVVTPCDYFNKIVRSCKKYDKKLKYGFDRSHGLRERLLCVKCEQCKERST